MAILRIIFHLEIYFKKKKSKYLIFNAFYFFIFFILHSKNPFFIKKNKKIGEKVNVIKLLSC